jgi:hypothetical protein
VLPLAESEVRGVPVLETDGVVLDEDEFLAAFSARRFCLDAEGAMMGEVRSDFLLKRVSLPLSFVLFRTLTDACKRAKSSQDRVYLRNHSTSPPF